MFVTSELNQEGKKSLLTLCYDRTGGRELWRHVKAGTKFELLAMNNLGERITASPAISGNELIYRTDSNLYCIGTSAGPFQ